MLKGSTWRSAQTLNLLKCLPVLVESDRAAFLTFLAGPGKKEMAAHLQHLPAQQLKECMQFLVDQRETQCLRAILAAVPESKCDGACGGGGPPASDLRRTEGAIETVQLSAVPRRQTALPFPL
jgi:hypothetical protein